MEDRYLLYAWREGAYLLAGSFNDIIEAFQDGEKMVRAGYNYRIWDRNVPGWSRRLFLPKPDWGKEGF